VRSLVRPLAIAAAIIAAATTAQADDMPEDLRGSWCWDGSGGPNGQTYRRCQAMAGGEDVEFNRYGREDEATISGAGSCRLKKVWRQPNLYVLDFTCGDRWEISGDPRSDHITITWVK
jgi:hypothetical protein